MFIPDISYNWTEPKVEQSQLYNPNTEASSTETSVEGCITVEDEDTYNNMNLAMYSFNKEVFNSIPKLYYSIKTKFLINCGMRSYDISNSKGP